MKALSVYLIIAVVLAFSVPIPTQAYYCGFCNDSGSSYHYYLEKEHNECLESGCDNTWPEYFVIGGSSGMSYCQVVMHSNDIELCADCD